MVPVYLKDQRHNQNTIRTTRPAPLEILNHVKFNTAQETPRSTIKGFLNLPNQTDLKFSKANLKKAEEQLKKAFIEFYHKLRLLKSYRCVATFSRNITHCCFILDFVDTDIFSLQMKQLP